MPASLIPRIVSSRDSDDSATPGKMSFSSLLIYKIPTGIYRNNFRNSNCKKYVLYRNNLAISMSLYIRSNLSIAARYQSQKPFENVENIRNILLNDLSLYIRKTLVP